MDYSSLRDFRIIRIAGLSPALVDDARAHLPGMTLFGLDIERIRIAGAIEQEDGQFCQRV